MKRMLSLAVALLLLCLSFLGCEQKPTYEKPVDFYYLSTDYSCKANSAVIQSEVRESAQLLQPEAIVRMYLAGPQTETLRSPFPANLSLVGWQQDETSVTITLSKEMTQLSGLRLILACGCISMTCMDLTGAESVTIQAEDGLLNGEQSIVMDASTLLLLDQNAYSEKN